MAEQRTETGAPECVSSRGSPLDAVHRTTGMVDGYGGSPSFGELYLPAQRCFSELRITVSPEHLGAAFAGYHYGDARGDEPLLPDERVDLADSHEAFTTGSAHVNHLDDITGSIEVGKRADLVVCRGTSSHAPSRTSAGRWSTLR